MTASLNDDLCARLLGLLEGTTQRVIVGIAGPPGVGKTTLVEGLMAALTERVGADTFAHLPMDGFHLADAQLDRLGLRNRKGAPETFDVDGYAAALSRIRAEPRRDLYVPGFERELEQPIAAALSIPAAARLILTEGNYLLLDRGGWRPVRQLLDEVWYLDDDPGRRRERLIARHVRFGKSRAEAEAWVERSDDPNAALVEEGRSRADLRIVLESL